jgi:hypothetical protein
LRIEHCPNCNFRLDVRSSEQNSKLHALLTDISQQKLWAGQRLSVEDWKRLMVSAWERANGRQARMFPSLDGNGFDVVYHRTSKMTKQELSELLEYAIAWAVQNDVRLPEAA